MRILHCAIIGSLLMMAVWSRSASAAIILDQANNDASGAYHGTGFTLSDAGLVSSGDALTQTAYLTSVSLKHISGGGDTAGDLYLKVFSGSPLSTATFVGVSTNAVDVASLGNGDLATWSFASLALDKDTFYSYVLGTTNDSSATDAKARLAVDTTNPLSSGGMWITTTSLGADDAWVHIEASTVIPEPASMVLMGLGGLCLFGRRR